MEIVYGSLRDIDGWMDLVHSVKWNFPGLETEESIQEHKKTVIKFMEKKQAICVKEEAAVIGVMLFSRARNMICCLAVSPQHRRRGIASALLTKALEELDRGKSITVSTFRQDDEKGLAPRALYKKFGFAEDALTIEFDYPNQIFVLKPECRLGRS